MAGKSRESAVKHQWGLVADQGPAVHATPLHYFMRATQRVPTASPSERQGAFTTVSLPGAQDALADNLISRSWESQSRNTDVLGALHLPGWVQLLKNTRKQKLPFANWEWISWNSPHKTPWTIKLFYVWFGLFHCDLFCSLYFVKEAVSSMQQVREKGGLELFILFFAVILMVPNHISCRSSTMLGFPRAQCNFQCTSFL